VLLLEDLQKRTIHEMNHVAPESGIGNEVVPEAPEVEPGRASPST
jgi:hypothetical protein